MIADFAAGNGDLLRAAEQRWSQASIVALDVDAVVVRRLRRDNAKWSIGKCDFLSQESRAKSRRLRQAEESKIDLVLLNPPFSDRGARAHTVIIGDREFQVSRALAFVVVAAEYLSNRGELLAILPQATLHSQKDRAAWTALRSLYSVSKAFSCGRGTFPGASARTVAVRVSKSRMAVGSTSISNRFGRRKTSSPGALSKVSIVRGCIPLHTIGRYLDSDTVPLVHTTELMGGSVHINGRRARSPSRVLSGPAVLLPRIGNPTLEKVAVFHGEPTITLSDCVIGLQCRDIKHAFRVASRIRTNWPTLAATYGGTCAPYLTISGLSDALSFLGIEIDWSLSLGISSEVRIRRRPQKTRLS